MQRTLNRSASFWVAAAVAAIALWTSAAPSITYPLYADEWQLTPAVTTAIFAVYPIMLVPTLVIFGNLSDYIGRRSTMLLGLLANLIGVLLFALAPDVVWVFLGRAFMGIGVGLSLSPATAAVLEFSKAGHEKRAGSVTTASTAVGLVLATLVGGALIQYAPDPTHLNFMVLAVVIAAVIGIAWFLPRHTAVEARGRWRPRPLSIPRGLRGYYAIAAVSVSGAYAVGGIILSLGANIARDLIQSDNAFVNGAILALNAATIGITAILARGVRPMTLTAFGGLAAVAGMALLILSSLGQSLPIFLIASVVIGIAYSFLFAGGLGIAGVHAPEHHRAGFLSAVYLVAYLVQGIVSLSLGGIATASTLGFALDMGGIVVALFGFGGVLLVLLFSRGARGASEQPGI